MLGAGDAKENAARLARKNRASRPLVFAMERAYSSSAHERDVGLGRGWSHSLAWSLVRHRRSLEVHAPFGDPVRHPLVPDEEMLTRSARSARSTTTARRARPVRTARSSSPTSRRVGEGPRHRPCNPATTTLRVPAS
ncbi:DUF6531 domain-containing protein [Sorangium cellulosum]|uniref:DUF6531 domain-containing protein n=1 Tax=Sorangium cellulosum TaxID=56 RepID=UPI003D9A9E45